MNLVPNSVSSLRFLCCVEYSTAGWKSVTWHQFITDFLSALANGAFGDTLAGWNVFVLRIYLRELHGFFRRIEWQKASFWFLVQFQ